MPNSNFTAQRASFSGQSREGTWEEGSCSQTLRLSGVFPRIFFKLIYHLSRCLVKIRNEDDTIHPTNGITQNGKSGNISQQFALQGLVPVPLPE